MGNMARIQEFGPVAVDAVWWAVTEHTSVVLNGEALTGVVLASGKTSRASER